MMRTKTPGLSHHADRATGKPITERRDHYADTDWLWDSVRLHQLLASPDDVFITGGSTNRHDFYPLFSKIFVLTIDIDTLTQRLQSRNAGDYGMHLDELKDILRTFEGFTRREIESGAIPIDSTEPLTKVTDNILADLCHNTMQTRNDKAAREILSVSKKGIKKK
jgi:hypothetical protein